ncbi:protein asteroid homolog 1-like [Leguminivora glycinivorella]|uniref:protein asteroid homolog 1-like n=1 Tax=Leguminivora glycinivorella TaxID=1035111 RepID=UPI00200D1780|nr:protein asteroid homolog 1-like [Leguminivora glycinivorella]
MRIRTFCKLVEVSELTPRELRDEAVVLDGQNLFYSSYRRAGFSAAFGIEADRYAAHLSQYLQMFKKANLKCYFLFKGGHQNMDKRLKKEKDTNIVPVLMKETYKQVLKEMDFEFVICEYESKKDIVELAQKLNCPIISYDIENCFSGLQYIPSTTLELQNDTIHCGYFLLKTFLRKYNLTADKLAAFIVLTDENIFPEGFFTEFFKNIKAPLGPFKRNLHLLRWLSKSSKQQISATIFRSVSAEDKTTFIEEEVKARAQIERRECGGLGAACLLDREAARVARADPCWFAKGVAAGHVVIDYVNLYRSKVFLGAPPISGFEQDNPTLLALDIIKYAYDLFTNFENDGFSFVYDVGQEKETILVGDTHSIRKPVYEAEVCVFENGWESVRSLGLLEHFAHETLQLESLKRLESVPQETRLLLLALAYFWRRRPSAPAALSSAVLLAYVMLDVVAEKVDKKNLPKFPFDRKPILDSTIDRGVVTEADCGIAAAIMEEYASTSEGDAELILDGKLIHALSEFQQCLLQLSALSVLCGAELPAPMFARTYNGTLAYKVLRAAQGSADRLLFLDELLSPAPTVYAYLNGILEAYVQIF